MDPSLPTIAILGRPNVGKSALFNRLCGRRLAIVDPHEGVTRDRLYGECELAFEKKVRLIDVGGLDLSHSDPFQEAIHRQIQAAIREADLLLILVDGQVEPTQGDLQVVEAVRREKKIDKSFLLINKIDAPEHEWRAAPYHQLGISPLICCSALHGWGVGDLLEELAKRLPAPSSTSPSQNTLSLALIGRCNVGKSTFINQLLQDERCVVSDQPGTTRDSLDIPFTYQGSSFTLIDTAGLRRKLPQSIDYFASLRTEGSIERAEICILLCDAQEGVTSYEKRVARKIAEAGKGTLLFFNKWDLVHGVQMEALLGPLRQEIAFLSHCPALCGSALKGRNLHAALQKAQEVSQAGSQQIPTGELNRFIASLLQELHPPIIQGRRLRIYYLTQIGVNPPRFLLFVNSKRLLAPSYLRYLQNKLRAAFGFAGYPIHFIVRGKKRQRPGQKSRSPAEEFQMEEGLPSVEELLQHV